MVSMVLSYRPKGALMFAPDGAKISASEYIGLVSNAYLPDFHQLCGVRPHLRAPSRRRQLSHIRCDAGLTRLESPRLCGPNARPPNSPDSDHLDYFEWGYIQGEVMKRPVCLDTMNPAIRKSAIEMPLDMLQRAIDSFPMRAEVRSRKEWVAFKDIRLVSPPEMDRPAIGPPSGAPMGDASEGGNVE